MKQPSAVAHGAGTGTSARGRAAAWRTLRSGMRNLGAWAFFSYECYDGTYAIDRAYCTLFNINDVQLPTKKFALMEVL